MQETGTLARASRRVGRTLSAVSLQLKRLEAQCGRPLFRKAGRRLELNAEGEQVLAVGRRMLALNDQLLEGLREDVAGATIRLGLPQDVAERWLPAALTRFTRAHPRAQLEVRVERNVVLQDLLSRALVDLAVTFDPQPGRPDPEEVLHPVRWLAAPEFHWSPGTPPRVVRHLDRRLPALPSLAFRVEGATEPVPGPLADLRALLIQVLREAAGRPTRVPPVRARLAKPRL